MGLGVVLRKKPVLLGRSLQVSVLLPCACLDRACHDHYPCFLSEAIQIREATWVKMPSRSDECARNFLSVVVQSPQIPGALALVDQRQAKKDPFSFRSGAVRLNAPSTDHGSTRVFFIFSHRCLHQSTEQGSGADRMS